MLFGFVTPATLVLLPAATTVVAVVLDIVLAPAFIDAPVACSICEISSTWSLFVLTTFFGWSLPNGDGISCFKTVNADDNDKNESLLNLREEKKQNKSNSV